MPGTMDLEDMPGETMPSNNDSNANNHVTVNKEITVLCQRPELRPSVWPSMPPPTVKLTSEARGQAVREP